MSEKIEFYRIDENGDVVDAENNLLDRNAIVCDLNESTNKAFENAQQIDHLKETMKTLLKFSSHYAQLLNMNDGGKRDPGRILIDAGIEPDTL